MRIVVKHLALALICVAPILAAPSGLELLDSDPLIVDPSSNRAGHWIRLHNASAAPVKVSVSVSDFRSKITGHPLGAKTTLSTAEDGARLAVFDAPPLAAGQDLRLYIEASNLWEAGEMVASLDNFGASAGQIRALKYKVPFNVKLDLQPPEKPEIVLQQGKDRELILKNDDGMTYPVAWRIKTENLAMNGHAVLNPNGAASILLRPPQILFATHKFARMIRPESADATLWLQFGDEENPAGPYAPGKAIPVKLTITDRGPGLQAFYSSAFILLILFLGGLSSMFLHFGMPNRLRSVDLKEQLAAIQRKNGEVSTLCDSRPRVLLGVEIRKLQDRLNKLWAFTPETSAVLEELSRSVASLGARVDLLQSADMSFRSFENLAVDLVPPTISDHIDANLRMALELLAKSETDGLQRVRTILADIENLVQQSDQKYEDLAGQIAERVTSLQALLEDQSADAQRLRRHLTGLFEELKPAHCKPAEISPDDYRSLDYTTQKLKIVQSYLRLLSSTTDSKAHQRIVEIEADLLQRLGGESWERLCSARRLVQETNEQIFQSHIEKAITQKQAQILIPPNIAANEGISFSIVFHHDPINRAAAKDDYVCNWELKHPQTPNRWPRLKQWLTGRPSHGSGDLVYPEFGWVISHYFPKPGHYNVKVSLRDRESTSDVAPEGTQVGVLEDTVHVQAPAWTYLGERTRVELMKLTVALATALFGLIAGAREQLAKLDMFSALIAIFLLGFGADTVKNLIAPRPAVKT